MTEDQAAQIVEARRIELEIGPELALASAERAIVPHKADPTTPGRSRDRVAWILTYASDLGGAKVYVDDREGTVLRVRRS